MNQYCGLLQSSPVWLFFVFFPSANARYKGPGCTTWLKLSHRGKGSPSCPLSPSASPTSPLSHRSPSLPPLWPALSPKPSSLPLRHPRRVTYLHTHQAVVEVHGGLQNRVPQPSQELSDEPAAAFETVPAAAPPRGPPVFSGSGLLATPAFPEACAARLGP